MTTALPFVAEIDGVDDCLDSGPERFLCLSLTISHGGRMKAIVQDARGQVFVLPSCDECPHSGISVRRVNMSVEDFLAGCKLED
jgi:hypothetical protein